ncbi:hypothetical protein J559_3097 [Acinetobacter sp. 983759]|nr:hypothetical protein J559_3097 [Acinetobacter sp. 983759]
MVYVALQVLLCLALGEAVIVCVDKENMQKTLIPEIIREKIIKIEKTVKHDLNNR